MLGVQASRISQVPSSWCRGNIQQVVSITRSKCGTDQTTGPWRSGNVQPASTATTSSGAGSAEQVHATFLAPACPALCGAVSPCVKGNASSSGLSSPKQRHQARLLRGACHGRLWAGTCRRMRALSGPDSTTPPTPTQPPTKPSWMSACAHTRIATDPGGPLVC